MNRTPPFSATGTDYDVPDMTTVPSNGPDVRKRHRTRPPTAAPSASPPPLPLIAALALAFVSLSLISGIAYIVVLAGATNTAERRLVAHAGGVGDSQVNAIRSRLDPVTSHLEMIAALAANGRLDINAPVEMRE